MLKSRTKRTIKAAIPPPEAKTIPAIQKQEYIFFMINLYIFIQKRARKRHLINLALYAFCVKNLYKLPVVNVRKIQEFTGLSREGANQSVKRFNRISILSSKDKNKKYGRTFVYKLK